MIRFTFEFLAWKYNSLEGIFEACKTGHLNNLLAFSDRRKALDQIDSFQWACNPMSIIFFVRKKYIYTKRLRSSLKFNWKKRI